MGERIENWAKTASCEPHRYYVPLDEEEVASIVTEAARLGRSVRVIGGGHSWSEAAMSDDLLVSLERISEIGSVEGMNVTVGAGTQVYALNRALAERGLALSSVGSIGAQSIAGAISTATHGSSLQHGVMSEQVVALRMVTADGSVRILSAQSEPELLDMARVSFGCLGIITAVTLRCEPAFRLLVRGTPLDIDEAIGRAVELGRAAEHAKLWWLPHTRKAMLFTAERVEAPREPRPLSDWLDEKVVNPYLFNSIVRLGDRVPALVAPLNRLVAAACFRPQQRVEDSFRSLHIPMPPIHLETEHALPLERASEALGGVRALIEDSGLRVNFIVELRYARGDRLPLSPCFGRDSCYIGGYIGRGRDAAAYMGAVEQLAANLDGRPHWGKRFTQTAEQLRPRYPLWDRFLEVREQLDPDSRLLNPFARRALGLDQNSTLSP
ncbi:MAG: FAD-linked oxidoreductase [Myxococcota bacterium]|jgi:FAD-linked oxidoreductase